MASLKFHERSLFEELFEMKGGYVLDFTNYQFKEFVFETVGIDIYADKYGSNGGSKANRLRTLIKSECNQLISELLLELLNYWKIRSSQFDPLNKMGEKYSECLKIATNLKALDDSEEIDYFKEKSKEDDLQLLSSEIIKSLEKGVPEAVLDRLHTFFYKYIRNLLNKHKILFDSKEPLHSLFGKYIISLKKLDLIESDLGYKLLKSQISLLDNFNDIRNNKSFAHDNEKILNRDESFFIVKSLVNLLKFIEKIEKKYEKLELNNVMFDNLPF